MNYTIKFRYTVGQEVWIIPFSTKGRIIEISIHLRGIVYEVRHISGDRISFSYLYEDELENYTKQDKLIP